MYHRVCETASITDIATTCFDLYFVFCTCDFVFCRYLVSCTHTSYIQLYLLTYFHDPLQRSDRITRFRTSHPLPQHISSPPRSGYQPSLSFRKAIHTQLPPGPLPCPSNPSLDALRLAEPASRYQEAGSKMKLTFKVTSSSTLSSILI